MHVYSINKRYCLKTINNEICCEGKVIYRDYWIVFDPIEQPKIEDFFGLYVSHYGLHFSVVTKRAICFGGLNDCCTWIKTKLKFPSSFKGELYIERDIYNGDERYAD